MESSLLQRAQRILAQVVDQGVTRERMGAFLDETCAGDAELRTEVESLLEFIDVPESFLSSSALADASDVELEATEDLTGREFQSYRIERRLASGGMGAVYLATRTLGDGVQQRVAFKVVKRGMDSEEIVRRFRQERRTLAKMSHPNIASMLDGGVLPDGRPYLAMEYVEGEPIDQAGKRLSIEQRLRLFATVCRAVHSAHQNLILHRDLKPGNILVTADGQPKLLDFGIAKVMSRPGEATVDATITQQSALTPNYASPEQILGDTSLTTATDVYSLGVVLYQLLSGVRPYHFEMPTLPALAQAMRELVVKLPSAMASDSQTARALRGDLDNIVLKAMRREPGRRYASAEEFADDIERHLAGMPVTARPLTTAYYLSTFVRRHAAASVAIAMGIITLAAVAGLIVVQNRRVARERDEAYDARNQSEMVVALMREALSADDPFKPGKDKTVRSSLEYLLSQLDARHRDDPKLRASVRHTIGLVDVSLGEFDKARALLSRAHDERLEMFGPLHHDVAESLMGLGALEFRTGRYEEAARRFSDALAIFRSVDAHPQTDIAGAYNDLGVALRAMGTLDEALEALEHARELRDPPQTPDGELQLAETYNNLANVHLGLKDFPAAHACMQRSLELRRGRLPEDHALVIQSMNNLAFIAINEGQFELARDLLSDAVPAEARTLGPDHPQHAGTLQNLGRALLNLGEYEAAEARFVQALAIRVARLPLTDPRAVKNREYLIRTLVAQHEFEAAQIVLNEALAPFEQLDERMKAERDLAASACELYEDWGRAEQLMHWQALRPVRE